MLHRVVRPLLRVALLSFLLGWLPPASPSVVQAASPVHPAALAPQPVASRALASQQAPTVIDQRTPSTTGSAFSLFVPPSAGIVAASGPLSVLQQAAIPERPVLVYRNDFEQSFMSNYAQQPAGSEWLYSGGGDHLQLATTPLGNRHFLAANPNGFSNDSATLSLTALPSHSRVTLDFDLFIIQTWDGLNTCCGPQDVWDLSVSGGPTLLHTTFAAAGSLPPWIQNFPDSYPGPSHPSGTGSVERNTLGFTYYTWPSISDSVYHLSFSFAHTAPSLALIFRDLGLQGYGDETWGLDNVQVRLGALPMDQQMNATCPACQFHSLFPVNTRTGNYWNKVTDLQVESPGVPIAWTRTYNSQAVDATTVLGAGWQHPYNTRLATASMSGGEAGRVIITSPTGNRLRFDDLGSNQYSAWPGVNSTLTRNGSTFTQTMRDQSQYLFRDSDGMLTAVRDPQGRQVNLVYNTTILTQLDQIVDASNSTRYLSLSYSSGRISSVTDSASPARSVSYGYDASGNLTSVTDVRQQVTTYSYKTPANHLLTRIRNPIQQDIEQIGYNTGVSPTQVVTQTLQDKRAVAFSFPLTTALGGTTTMTSTGVDGRTDVVQLDYAGDNTLVGMRNTTNSASVWQELSSSYDDTFSPGLIRDGNGNPTTAINTTQGLPITTTNALGQVSINTYDTKNNLTRTVDPLGITTRYRYDTFSNVISTTAGLASANQALATTLWTYQYKVGSTWGSTQTGATDSRLYEQTSPDGVVTRYLYDDANSQPHRVIKVIVGPGTAAEQQTTYAYDGTGRVQTTTVAAGTTLARVDRTDYNADNTIAKTTQNYKGTGVFSAATPDTNITTFYGYDKLGRTIAITDTLGHVDVTRYNAKGQVEASARNIAKPWSRDAQGQPIIPAFSITTPDTNIATLYGYDGLGRTILVTETGILTGSFDLANLRFTQADTRVTRTQYDELGRPTAVTRNYRANDTRQTADINVTDTTTYDASGNVTLQVDALGRWTKTEYDVLNRPTRVIRNYESGQVDANEPADRDLISTTAYDAGGRVSQTIENYVNGVVDATDTITDRTTLYSYDSLGRTLATTANAAAGRTGQEWNRQSQTQYDPTTTRTSAQRTPQFTNSGSTDERWTRMQQYDPVGRLQIAIQNCRTSAGVASATSCAAYSTSQRDRNIATRTTYDVLGRVSATTQNYVDGTYTASRPDEDVTTTTTYDGVGRVLTTTRNYINGVYSDSAPAEDVITQTSYDGLGRTTAMTETMASAQKPVTRYTYDNLGRLVSTTDPSNRVTQMGYDGGGAQRWTRLPDGRVNVTRIDGLGRPIATIQNYQNGSLDGDPADRDLITRTVYDTAGRRVQTIDPANHVTEYTYDNADRLISVKENVVSGCVQTDCNALTQYKYDRVGNRTKIIDPLGHVRSFSFNAADEQTAATDALAHTTTWSYDALGRAIGTVDPRGGTSNNLTLTYDGLDRPKTTSATNLGTITNSYDALGRRTSLNDPSGAGTPTTFTYDALGRMTQLSAPNTGTVQYSYNGLGLRTKLTYPTTGTVINYNYLTDGRLSTVTQGASSPTTQATYAYDPVGRLAQVATKDSTTPNSQLVTNYGYDGADRLRALRSSEAGTTISGYQIQTDRLGLRSAITETLPLSPTLSTTRIKTITFEGASLTDPVTGADSVQQTATAVVLTTTNALKGSYSAVVPNTINSFLRQDFSAADEVYAAFYLRMNALPPTNIRIAMFDAGGTTGNIVLTTLGKLRLRNGSNNIGLDTAALTLGATYRVALHQKKGTGTNNALVEGYLVSDDNLFSAPFAASAGEAFTAQTTRFQIGATTSTAVAITIDDITLDTASLPGPSLLAARATTSAAGSASLAQTTTALSAPAPDVAAANGRAMFGRLPLAFVPNAGQTDASVRFQVRGIGGALFFTADELVMALHTPTRPKAGRATSNTDNLRRTRANQAPPTVVRAHWIGSNPTVAMTGTLRLPGRANYLIGNDPSKWRTNLATYADMATRQLYPGIDLYYQGLEGQLKRTYVVAPGADPNSIRWRYQGADSVSVDAAGNLVVQLPAPSSALTDTETLSSTLTERAPVAWQTINEREVAVPVRYLVGPGGIVSFVLGTYDTTQPLTIDPTLYYSTYFGGSSADSASAIAINSAGEAYVTGHTQSIELPPPNPRPGGLGGTSDAFVARLNASGNALLYSTYLGGSLGGNIANEFGTAIAVDIDGNAYITGDTTATNFPVTPSARQNANGGAEDAFVTKLSADGSTPLYSTYLGGSADEFGNGIAIDSSGKIYVAGETFSGAFPTQYPKQPAFGGGSADAFVAKIDPTLSGAASLVYSTYLGGTGDEVANAIAVDSSNNAYVTGQTSSTSFPKTTGVVQGSCAGSTCVDAFVTKYTWSGTTLNYGYSTFLGGSATDSISGIAVDSAGNATLTGWTNSTDFPAPSPVLVAPVQANNAGNYDVVIARLNVGGSALLYRSYLGGSGNDYAAAVALDTQGAIFLVGQTASTNFPLANPIQVTNQGGAAGVDAIIAKIDPTIAGIAGLIYSTYLGGTGDDGAGGIAVDSANSIYIAGATFSTNFPLSTPIRSTGVGQEGFVAKLANSGRVTQYTYDGLQRLIGAIEHPGSAFAYGYDLAGNRTSVTINGGTPAVTTYNLANQISNAGFSYDNAGNLLGDGTASYSYDALNRTLTRGGTSYTYNGDGTLVSQLTSGITTRYTQDLAAPLTQVLQTKVGSATPTDYLYGLNRLASLNGSTKTWYAADALGSVRRTVTDTGTPLGVVNYDPWGAVETGTIPTFGFTGELHDSANGLVNLRARWYSTARGRFTSVDPFAGMPEQPYSLHQYAYGYSDPVLMTDPQGTSPWDIKALEGIYIGAVIQNHFVLGDRKNRVAELEIPGASKKYPNRVAGYADMVDFSNGEMYEIKPKGGTVGPEEQLQRYLWHIAKAGVYGQVDPPATGKWHRGDTYLTTEQSFGLWPYGIDPQFIPGPNSTYWVIKAQRTQPGVIEYWGEQVSDDRAQKEAWNYDPDEIIGFIERTYQDWRKEKFPAGWPGNGPYRPRPYPNLVPVPPIISQIKEACWQMLIDLSHLGEQLQNPFAWPLPSPGSWPAKGRY